MNRSSQGQSRAHEPGVGGSGRGQTLQPTLSGGRLGRWWIYECSPIDYWTSWQLAIDWLDGVQCDSRGDPIEEGSEVLRERRLDLLIAIAIAVKDAGWEGDGTWLTAPLPNPDGFDCRPMFAVKQNNNGSTFITSPFRLPWLDEWVAAPALEARQ